MSHNVYSKHLSRKMRKTLTLVRCNDGSCLYAADDAV